MVLDEKPQFENCCSVPVNQALNTDIVDTTLTLLSQIKSDFMGFFPPGNFYNPTLEKSEYQETFDSEDKLIKYYIILVTDFYTMVEKLEGERSQVVLIVHSFWPLTHHLLPTTHVNLFQELVI